ncbi:DNA invertase Pin-like site-specific DNA recombinase [Tenacibaculum adriaticum]|uniref:DNA invertase Pin-like site-specific DNA recombinase n=1 Tax=Tenacibaculum adriaticum TaxID=413713 RepID=A0A5S5DZQ0_9FLAO|nr:recombinase family protein [Tenacibaculum adriaticum]TYQ00223.1 DNA invertase Pin-like site-specific DNA recombinase [Tenacibaculum adriaticum]
MKNWKNKKAVLIARVSTTDQKDNGYSLPQQKDLLYDFCNRNNIEVVEYLEEDYTGTTLERPQIKRLRKLVSSKKIDLVLFHKWDRFSRKTSLGLVEIEKIQDKGIEINAIAEYIDFNIPQQRMMLFMYLGLGEVENAVRSQRTKNGIIGALKEGRHVNKAPIGYLNAKDPNNPSKPLIVPCPTKAPLIQDIFNEYATGYYSQEHLRKKYQKLGITRSKSQFSNMLSNILYTGKIIIPENNGNKEEIRNALHEPIIDIVTFNKVQKVKSGKANVRLNSKKNSKYEEIMPLRGGVLECSKCGRNLTGSPSKSRNGSYTFYYHCDTKKGCGERFRIDLAHYELEVLLNSLKPPKEVVELFKEILIDSYKSNQSNRINTIKKLKKQRAQIEEKLDNTTEKYIENAIDKESYLRLKNKYKEQISSLTISIDEYSDYQKDISLYIDFGINLLTCLSTFYKKARTEIKRKIIGSIFSEKLIFEDKKYRTAKLNDAISLIFSNSKGLEVMENKKGESISKLSYSVAGTGLEPVTFGL